MLAPSLEHRTDPRLPKLIRKAGRRYGIPERRQGAILSLVTGEITEGEFYCCNSGCSPCAMDFREAGRYVRKALAQDPEASGGVRGLARRGLQALLKR